MDSHGPDSRKAGVDEEGDQRVKDRADEHDAFAQKQKDRKHSYHDIEGCGARRCQQSARLRGIVGAYN